MADGYCSPIAPFGGIGDFVAQLSRYTGETVTIFTTSGGESGRGFTGVLTLVTPEYVRLVTSIGLPPNCSLGNPCDLFDGCGGFGFGGGYGSGGGRRGFGYGGSFLSRFSPLGSMVDIPIARIAGFVHNTY